MISKTIVLPVGNDPTSIVLPFENAKLSFKKPYSKQNKLPISITIEILDNHAPIIANGDFNLNLRFSKMDFILAQGYLAEQTLSVGASFFDIDLDLFSYINGDVEFVDPNIIMNVKNGFGLPSSFQLFFKGKNASGVESKNKSGVIVVDYPKNIPEIEDGISSVFYIDDIELDPNILISYVQNGSVEYYYDISFGGGLKDTPHLISKKSNISLDMEVDLPFYIKANNLFFTDTIKNINIDNVDEILDASLFLSAKNAIPLGVTLNKIYLADENYNIIDSLESVKLIKPAKVFPEDSIHEGESAKSSHTINEENINLTASQIEKLDDVKALIIHAELISESQEPVKLMKDDRLDFSIAIRAKLDVQN